MSIALPQCPEHQVPPISGFIMTGCLWRILVNGLSTRVYTNSLCFSLRYYAQLPHHSRIFLLALSGKFTLKRTLLKCVQGQREKAKLQSILLNFFMVVEEKVRGNLILLSEMQLYVHDYSIYLRPA